MTPGSEPLRPVTHPDRSHPVRPAAPRWRAWITATMCGVALMLIAFIALWLRQTSTHVYTQGADALVIRAVLRANVDVTEAEKLATRLKQATPDLTIEVINEAMGRSLLALQEPWIAQMPDFEVTPLPTLLEIKHPDLLLDPLKVTRFVEQLGKEPEVDFVAYNETAHDRLTKLADATRSIQSHTLRWLLIALALAGFAAQVAFCAITPSRSLTGLLIRHVTIWIVSWVLSVAAYRIWENGAVASGDWTRLASTTYLLVGVSALAIIMAAEVTNVFIVRLRR